MSPGLGRWCVLLVVTLFGLPAQADRSGSDSVSGARLIDVSASEHDPRRYKALELGNGLQVLLIEDVRAEDMRWAIGLEAGRGSDPGALSDLHKLAAQVVQVAGNKDLDVQFFQNAVIFQPRPFVRQPKLQDAVRLLSPLQLNEVHIARAQQLLAEDIRSRRQVATTEQIYDVLSTLAASQQPLNQSPGQSVSIVPMEVLSPALEQYLKAYYRPDKATLVVRSAASLDDVEAKVKSLFAGVSGTPMDAPAKPASVGFTRETLPLDIVIKSPAGRASLHLLFPYSESIQSAADKPLAIMEYLVTRHGSGSLLALLKDLGWAERIDFEVLPLDEEQGYIALTVGLTSLGVRGYEQVEALVFHVLDNIRERALDAWRLDEIKRAGNFDFLYDDAFADRDLGNLAHRLLHIPAQLILRAPFEYGEFEPLKVKRAMDVLHSRNVISVLQAPDVETDRLAPHTHALFAVSAGEAGQPDIKPEIKRRLRLPEKDRFVPQRLTVKSSQLLPGPQNASSSRPVLLIEKPHFTAWYQGAAGSALPNASVYLRLGNLSVRATAEEAVHSLLSTYLLAELIDTRLRDAERAGVHFEVRPTVLGLDLVIHGYNAQLGLILSQIHEVYDQPLAIGKNLERASEWLRAQLQTDGPVVSAFTNPFLLWLYQPYWSQAELLRALERVEAEQWRYGFSVNSVQMLISGSLYRQEAERLAALTELYLMADEPAQVSGGQLVTDGEGQSFGLERRTSQLQLLLRAGSNTARDHIFVRALAELLNGEFIALADGPEVDGEPTAPPVAVRAEQVNIAGFAGLVVSSSPDVLTGSLLQALQLRLQGADIAPRLDDLKRRWRADKERTLFATPDEESAWLQLVNPLPVDNRAALAALNSASVERYAAQLFAANIYLMGATDERRKAFVASKNTVPVGQRLPVDFPAIEIE